MLRSNLNVWIVSLAFLGVSHLTGGTAERWSQGNSYPKFSAQIPSSSATTNRRVSAGKESYDYSSGFPQGFAQGLPTFDFTGPMPSADEQKEQQQAASETENVGFVHGPPDGFPTLEQLGGKFPNFGESVEHSPSKKYEYHHQPSPQTASSSHPEYSREEEDDDYVLGPGPSSVDNPVQRMPHRGHSHSHGMSSRPPLPPTPYSPSQSQYRRQHLGSGSGGAGHGGPSYNPSAQASGNNPHAKYPGSGSPSPYGYKSKKPILLKVSGKRTRPGSEGLPPGPPVFYAPSPDMQSSSQQQQQDSVRGNSYQPHPHNMESQGYNGDSGNHPNHRYRRSTTPLKNKSQTETVKKATEQTTTSSSGEDDMKTAASDTDTYWELTSSPFIVFDTYKKAENEAPPSSNITFLDTDGGEQRFFPSFPGPAPYLAGPFGGGPPSSHRPPLFPGPAANRAPSRYHPQYNSGPKFSPPPPPNRGPSNVYSAESHDHYQDNNLLGSGNFEVVRGGTYYGDDDEGYHGGGGGGGGGGNAYHGHGGHGHDDDDYYHHNGHSSPQEGYRVPGQDFFANFRDFADINPPSRSFSHRHEALAAEPRETITIPSQSRAPKNILDKLESSSLSDNSPKARQSASAMSRESDPMMATF